MNKEKWIDIAEIIDTLRIIPRIILLSACLFALYYVWITTTWYFALLAVPGITEWHLAASTAFAGVTIPAVLAIVNKVWDSYLKGGRDWNARL